MQLLKTPKRRSKTTTDGRDAKIHLCRQWWWHCRAGIALCRIMGIETARQTQKDHQDRAYIKSWRATGPTAADATKVDSRKGYWPSLATHQSHLVGANREKRSLSVTT